MHLLFLLPLSIALIAGYISQKSSDEICYLTGTLTAMTLVLSLLLAPWQFQVVILILGIAIARQFWLQLESRLEPATTLTETTDDFQRQDNLVKQDSSLVSHQMTRTYRGVSYETTPLVINGTLPQTTGKYRGSPCSVGNSQTKTEKASHGGLKYRGIDLIPDTED